MELMGTGLVTIGDIRRLVQLSKMAKATDLDLSILVYCFLHTHEISVIGDA